MTIIDTKNHLPGIIGLLAFNPSTAVHINGLAEQLLRTESDTLSRGERELLAAVRRSGNGLGLRRRHGENRHCAGDGKSQRCAGPSLARPPRSGCIPAGTRARRTGGGHATRCST